MRIRWRQAWPASGGLILLALPFWRVLWFSDRALLFRDLVRDFIPHKVLLATSWRNGAGIPAWNHYLMGGSPFIAYGVHAPYHPLNFLYLLPIHPNKATVLYLWLHYAAIYFGGYLLGRQQGLSRGASVLGGLMLPLSGLLLSLHCLPHFLSSAAAVPYWIYGIREVNSRRSLLAIWLTGAAIGWPVIAGDPQLSYVMGIGTGLWVIWRSGKQESKKALISGGIMALSALLFCGAQLLPLAGQLLQSERWQHNADRMLLSLHPYRLVEAVAPLFFGSHASLAQPFWGERLVNFAFKSPFVFSIYPGIFLILLALYRPISSHRGKWLGASVFFLFLSFGEFITPSIYGVLADFAPGFGLFRYPERFAFWWLLSLWMAALISLSELQRNHIPAHYLGNIWLPGILALAGAGFTLLFQSGWIHGQKLWHGGSIFTAITGSIWLAILLRYGYRRNFSSYALYFGYGSLLSFSFFFGPKLVWDHSVHATSPARYQLLRELQSRIPPPESPEARRISSLKNMMHPFWPGSLGAANASTNFSMQAILPNTGIYSGLEDAHGYLSLSDSARERLMAAFLSDADRARGMRIFEDIMAVRFVPEVNADGSVKIRENPSAQPYVHSPTDIKVARDLTGLAQLFREGSIRSDRGVVTFEGIPALPPGRDPVDFRILIRDGNQIKIQVRGASFDGLLPVVINESFHLAWKAKWQGKDLPLRMANGWSMLSYLPANQLAGGGELTLTFKDPAIPVGCGMSLVWLLLLASLIGSRLARLRHKIAEG